MDGAPGYAARRCRPERQGPGRLRSHCGRDGCSGRPRAALTAQSSLTWDCAGALIPARRERRLAAFSSATGARPPCRGRRGYGQRARVAVVRPSRPETARGTAHLPAADFRADPFGVQRGGLTRREAEEARSSRFCNGRRVRIGYAAVRENGVDPGVLRYSGFCEGTSRVSPDARDRVGSEMLAAAPAARVRQS